MRESRRALWRVAAISGGLLLLWACPRGPGSESEGEGGSGGSGDAPASGADSEARLDQLSHSELQQYCQDLNQELSTRFDNRRLATYACTRSYIQNGDSLSCNLGVSDCLVNNPQVSPGAPRPPDFALDNAECDAIGRCKLTLGEFDRCIGDRFQQSEELLGQATCRLADDPQAVNQLLQQIDNPRVLPQSCVGVAGICPELL